MSLRRGLAFRCLAAVAICFVFIVHLIPHKQLRPALKITKSSFNWGAVKPFYKPLSLTSLPSGAPKNLPRIQHHFGWQSKLQAHRRNAVKKSFLRGWNNYKEYAWMRDELSPLSAGGKDTFGGWAATLIDSLDTLWIMGLKDEFQEAVEAVVTLDWARTEATSCNIFETTIRHLGGLLAAFELSGEPALLEKAIELGDMLYAGFDTPNRMPPLFMDFEKAKTGQLLADTNQPSATPASLSVEFTRLSQLTGDPKYYDAINRVSQLLFETQNATKLPGMWPTFFNLRDGILTEHNSFTLGALSDSMYEYLPKMYALLGGLEPNYKEMYLTAAETIKANLLFRPMTPKNEDVLFTGTAHVDSFTWLEPEGQHLACFSGGMFALGGRLFQDDEHVEIGTRLARGCAWAYGAFPTGIMPEIFRLSICKSLTGCAWDEDKWRHEVAADQAGHVALPKGFRNARAPSYILRPEAIESVFILYRVTGLEEFRDVAWDMFQSIESATRTPYGNAAIDDVTVTGAPPQSDSMESFWLAETLKYFYLIFSPPDVISLDEWIFNTEAHPIKMPKP